MHQAFQWAKHCLQHSSKDSSALKVTQYYFETNEIVILIYSHGASISSYGAENWGHSGSPDVSGLLCLSLNNTPHSNKNSSSLYDILFQLQSVQSVIYKLILHWMIIHLGFVISFPKVHTWYLITEFNYFLYLFNYTGTKALLKQC